jgi:hypothetical protein
MIRLGAGQWEIYSQGECEDCRILSRLRDRFAAQQWLRQFKGSALAMNELRNILARESSVGWRMDSASDDEIIEQAAQLLSFGVWHVHALGGLNQLQRGSAGKTADDTEAPPAPPIASAASKPAEAVESPTFSSQIDPAALASALLAASARGMPFCPP